MIDKTAVIHSSAQIGKDVSVGPWSVIGPNVVIGDGTNIGPHVVIDANTTLGKDNRIYQFASIGSDPQHLSCTGDTTRLEIGDNNVIREFVTINRATSDDDGVTRIGDHNYLMAYCHVAHNCQVGSHIIFANNASIAGHVVVNDHAILGAFAGVHQYCHIGAYSFLGRATKVYKDVLPYVLVTGNPATASSLNSVGLRRNGFSADALKSLKQAFNVIFRQGLKLDDIRGQLEQLTTEGPEIQNMLKAINQAGRGFAR